MKTCVQCRPARRKLRRLLIFFLGIKILLLLVFFFINLWSALIFEKSESSSASDDHNFINNQRTSIITNLKTQEDASLNRLVNWTTVEVQENNKTSIKASNDRIFFHETSGRMELSFKDSCAIESAAFHNPQRPVQIFLQPEQQQQQKALNSSSKVMTVINSSSAWFQVLSQYQNIQVIVIDDEELYFKDSPLEDWYKKGQWRSSSYRATHMSDYIRMVSLKKQGGMYLDLDVLSLKPYNGSEFRNFVSLHSAQMTIIPNGILHLDQNHPLVELTLEHQAKEYLPDSYTFNGPEALSSALIKLCNETVTALDCAKEIRIMKHHHFFPIGTAFCQFIFQRQPLSTLDEQFVFERIQISHGFHFHNSLTRNNSVDFTPNSTQVFARLAAQNCPLTFSLGHQFIENVT